MSSTQQKNNVVITAAKAKTKTTVAGWVIGVISLPVLVILLVVIIGGFALVSTLVPTGSASGTNCLASSGTGVPPAGVVINPNGIFVGGKPLSADQKAIAETIIGIGVNRQVSDPSITVRDIQTILTIGLQESHLTNLPGGTGASLGVFQQTPPYWGTPEQIMDVQYATNNAYDHLLQVPDRASKTMLQVALEIQHPDPKAYNSPANNFESWVPVAAALMANVGQPDPGNPSANAVPASPQPICVGTDGVDDHQTVDGQGLSGGGTTSIAACLEAGPAFQPMVEIAIQNACSVLGTPYVWGGSSEAGGFDCSGLVWWAFSQAGWPVGGRTTAADQYNWPSSIHLGVRVPPGAFQRGDLVFWANSSDGIHHVAIYLGNGMIVAAPRTGKVVQVEPIYNQGEIIGGVRL